MDNIWTVINTGIAGLVGLCVILVRSHINGKKRHDPIKNQNIIDDNVIAALNYIKKELNADRVLIQEFHNGGKYYSGNSQHKLSITYEVCGKGISSIFRKFQNVRVTALCNIIKKTIQQKSFIMQCKDDDCPFIHDLEHYGVNSIAYGVLKTLTDRTMGLLSIQYIKRDKRTLTERERKIIDRQRKIISGYLVSHDF
jgi:hypothetical protein